MAPLMRHRTTWTGFVGGPGVTTLYWDAGSAVNLTAWNAFLTAIQARFPTVVTWQSQNQGDVIESTTGVISGSWAGAAQPSVSGTGVGAYTAPSGCVINWRTAGVVDGRRLRGRSFMVPLHGGAYDSDGTISAAALTSLRTALATFQAAAAPVLQVWSRPLDGAGGSNHTVTSADIPDKAAILRSRRD